MKPNRTEITMGLKGLDNPYKRKATAYFKGYTPVYLWNGKSYTEDEINEAYMETATKDFINGFQERIAGYYDKWYRYNHADGGAAYDRGQHLASTKPNCKDDLTIIPCMH